MKSQRSKVESRKSAWKWAVVFATGVATFAHAGMAWAQGCAMCYNTASAASAGAIQALRSGILVLLFPPLLLFLGIFALALRRRNSFDAQEGIEADGLRETVDLGIESLDSDSNQFPVSNFQLPAEAVEVGGSKVNTWR